MSSGKNASCPALRIEYGGHGGTKGACVMEWVSILSRRLYEKNEHGFDIIYESRAKTDAPKCTEFVIRTLAVAINDGVIEGQRHKLAEFIPRILRAKVVDEDGTFTEWLLENHLDLLEENKVEIFTHRDADLIATPLLGFAEHITNLRIKHGLRAEIENLSGATLEENVTNDLLMFLSDMLDLHEKFLVETGHAIWDPDYEYPPDEDVEEIVQLLKGDN